jgi:uncharacterized protein (TIGR03083 family)
MGRSARQHDLLQLARAELGSIAHTATQFSERDFRAASLCDGWEVHDVLAHLAWNAIAPPRALLTTLVRGHLHPGRAMATEFFHGAVRYRQHHDTAGIIAILRELASGERPFGAARLVGRPAEFLVDYVVHHADIRRPLGLAPRPPDESVARALDAAPTIGGLIAAKRRVRGLRLVATDLDWHRGTGPTLQGTAEALLLGMTGRRVALKELSGDGVAVLADRLGR